MSLPTTRMDKLRNLPDPVFRSFGIYALRCDSNQRVYVGLTSKPFVKRWLQHRTDLRMHQHMRRELQQDWDAYGDEGFTCTILEVVLSVDELKAREQWHILTTARAIGARQMYNSFFANRAAREEFGITTKLSPGGMEQVFSD